MTISEHQVKQIKQIDSCFLEAMKPEPMLTVSQWAEQHRVLSQKSSSEPGKWSNARTPYLVEIMNCLSVTHPAKKIVFKKSSQIGGTEAGNNWIGYIIDHAPGPAMIVQPTVDTAKRNSRLRVEPLIDESPRLREKISAAKSRDAANTVLQKDFPGGTLVMTGANSSPGLRSMPAKYVMLDEVDAFPIDVDGEGDPISLVMARSRTFSRRKAFVVSTPTLDGSSKIDSEFELSDKRFYNVPCPHCNHFQILEFKNLQWTEGKPDTVLYYCSGCGAGIEERFKTKMLREGKWVATAESDVVGFHINSLYSPVGWFSWSEIAADYEEAKRDAEKEKKTEKLRTFFNTVLGETYKEEGDSPEWQKLYNRREDYVIGFVPDGVCFLTCGVDVQKDRLEMEVIGWGEGKESWSIDFNVIPGDTGKDEVWSLLGEYLERTFINAAAQEFPIKLTAIDSGYNTQQVYNFCRKYPSSRVIPVKGNDSLLQIMGHPKAVDVKIEGKTIRRGVKLWSVGIGVVKSELYSYLKQDPVTAEGKRPPGYCHFPQYGEEYFKQLTAESVQLKKNRKGQIFYEFIKTRERNEALDCRVYGRAAASLLGMDRYKTSDWDRFKIQTVAKKLEKRDNSNAGDPEIKRERVKRRRDSDFW